MDEQFGPPPPPSAARPVSRHPQGRPDSRSMASNNDRPMSRVARLQSAVSNRPPTSSLRQGTASMRAPTARMTGITGGSLPLHASVNVLERPVTQQGVSGLRTARTSYGNRRMVHDKTYFVGLLHTKMSEMGVEIEKLSTQVDAFTKEQSTYLAYESRVKEKAAELQELHGELQDLNILSEMLTTDKDKTYLEDELKSLEKENAADSEQIELVYKRRQEAEREIGILEGKIEEERNRAHGIIESLKPQARDHYIYLQDQNVKLQGEMERLQVSLDNFNSKKSELYDRICRSEIKKRAAEMGEELLELDEKRDTLLKESHSAETPEEEKTRVMAQVKADNSEITALERQVAEISELIRKMQEEIQVMDQEMEETDSDRQQKFRELKKREQDMDDFLQNFEDNKGREMETLSRIEGEIVNCMERISRNVHLASTLPETGHNFFEMREELDFKEDEFDKAKYTTEMIEYRNEALRKQLENFHNLEEKMKEELQTLPTKMEEMQKEIKKFQDIDAIKIEGNEKLKKLQAESAALDRKIKGFTDVYKSIQKEHEKLKKELDQSDIHRQLVNLEKKWTLLEESNYNLSQFLQAKKAETNVEGVRSETLSILKDFNTMLQAK